MPGPKLVTAGGRWTGEDAWRNQLLFSRDGIKDSRANIVFILRDHPLWKGALALDEFSRRLVIRKPVPINARVGEAWEQRHDMELNIWLGQAEGLDVRSMDNIALAVAYVAGLQTFHPVREFLEGLRHDGEPRLDSWAARYLGAKDSDYTRLVGRYFLLNMVRRAFEPGCIMRSVVVLEGRQNAGKSRALRALADPWYADTPFRIGDKDAYQVIEGVWLFEISELQSFRGREAEEVKAFISSTRDRYRAPYDRAPRDHDRQTVFAATTNTIEWAKDYTGATRFWPLKIGEAVDLPGLEAARDQLLAEALMAYRAGGEAARAHPTREDEKRLFEPEQELRLATHPWVDAIAEWLENNPQILEISTRKVLEDCLGLRAMDMGRDSQAEQRVGKAMAKLGWQLGWVKTGKRTAKVWRRPEALEDPEADEPEIEVPF